MDVLKVAHATRDRRESFYQTSVWASYVLYAIGWGLTHVWRRRWGGSSIAAPLIRYFAVDGVNALGSLAAKSASE